MNLLENDRFDEMRLALGDDQMGMLIGLLPASYDEERGRLIDAVNRRDHDDLRKAAHGIKGMAANLAAVKLAEEARKLEQYEGALDDAFHLRIDALDQLVTETIDAMQGALGPEWHGVSSD